ncbi:hypothetical protein EBB07_10710 [Paenibacillaceae bacterium]|nr:hypothetical protein EBB07_10710 [Paenibacillaceae bacterium]
MLNLFFDIMRLYAKSSRPMNKFMGLSQNQDVRILASGSSMAIPAGDVNTLFIIMAVPMFRN